MGNSLKNKKIEIRNVIKCPLRKRITYFIT